MQKSYLFLADGFEEIEALTPVDVLRRAGMPVATVSIMPGRKTVVGAHGVSVEADMLLGDEDISAAEWLILPGGMPGATNLAACTALTAALKAQHQRGGKIAAICASPGVVLGPLGIADGVEITGYPGFEASAPGARWQDAAVCSSGSLVTGNGPAAALPFALAIVAATLGPQFSHEIGTAMMYYPRSMNLYV